MVVIVFAVVFVVVSVVAVASVDVGASGSCVVEIVLLTPTGSCVVVASIVPEVVNVF